MLSRKFRFHGYNSLNPVYRHGLAARGSSMSLRFQPNPRRRTYRAAVVVSKKVHKSAVVRNRIRRRIYEAIRLSPNQPQTALDLILTVHDEQIANVPPARLQAQIDKLLAAAHQ